MAYGQGSIWQNKDGTWIGQIDLGTDAEGRRRRRRFQSKNRAEVLAKMDDSRIKRRNGPSRPLSPLDNGTVESWATHWLDNVVVHSVDPETLKGYRTKLRYLRHYLGHRKLHSISESDLENLWVTLAKEGLAPGTIVVARTITGMCFKEAARRGLIERNPALYASGPKRPGPRLDGLSPTEAIAVLGAARGDRLEAAAVLLLWLGLRNEELRGLRWADADLTANPPTLTVRRSKTPAGRRKLEISPSVAEALRVHRLGQAKERLAGGPFWADHGIIFARTDGRPMTTVDLLRWWQGLTVRAGLGKRRVHAARHTAATVMLDNDTALETVGQVLGHTKHHITVDFYGGQAKRRTATAIATMDRVLSSYKEEIS